mmetsp:Transcript_829/g.1802  ORF Transcript_829/g.1802 Transcript_829/m.1802 type:complete len:101 (+) Transcript_829:551-853(+)
MAAAFDHHMGTSCWCDPNGETTGSDTEEDDVSVKNGDLVVLDISDDDEDPPFPLPPPSASGPHLPLALRPLTSSASSPSSLPTRASLPPPSTAGPPAAIS